MTCKDCTERRPACHMTCEAYEEFKRQNIEKKKLLRGWKEKEALYADFREKQKRKRRRKTGK